MMATKSQSCTWIVQALFKLLENQSYETITVTQIANQAQLSRRTFYRLFSDKAAVLDYYNRIIGEQYVQGILEIDWQDRCFGDVLDYFFEFWWDERQSVRLLIQRGLFDKSLQYLISYTSSQYHCISASWHLDIRPSEVSYIMQFSTGGLWQVLQGWLNKSHPESPTKMATLLTAGMNSLATNHSH